MTAEEKHEMSIVEPIAPTQKLVEAMKRFDDLKQRILNDDDYQEIWVRVKQPDGSYEREKKKFMVKSAFRKFALAFGLSNRLIDEQRVERPDNSFMWKIKVEVVAPNGRTSFGLAVCDSRERDSWAHLEHDVYSTAFTRALNRGISDMIVGGAVSAEEVETTTEIVKVPPISGAGLPPTAGSTVPPGPVKGHLSQAKKEDLVVPPRTPQSRASTGNQAANITTMCRKYLNEFGFDLLPIILEREEVAHLGALTFEQAEEVIKWLGRLLR